MIISILFIILEISSLALIQNNQSTFEISLYIVLMMIFVHDDHNFFL